MTIKVTKPSINLREKLNELGQDTGLKGQELMRADTVAEARTAIGAGRKNLIINGGMDVWQRGTSFTNSYYNYGADRWQQGMATAFARSTDVPTGEGFNYSAKATTPANNNGFRIMLEDSFKLLGSQTSTVSFWVKTSVPAVVGVDLSDQQTKNFNTNTSWQKVTKTFSPVNSTAHGGTSVDYLDIGVAGTACDVYVTGVQLELGSVATDFEHRSYGEELALCQRYYQIHYSMGSGVQNSSTLAFCVVQLPVSMRNRPTLGTKSGLWSNINLERSDTYDVTSASTIGHGSANNDLDSMSSFFVSFYTTGSRTVGEGIAAACDKNSDHFTLSAEL